MRKIAFIVTIIILTFTVNSFGQKQKKKSFRPEIDDEVIIAFRKKQAKSNALRKKSSKCQYPMCGGKTSMVNKLKSSGNEVAIESLERKSATPFDKGYLPPAINSRSKNTLLFDEADALFKKSHEHQNQLVFEPNDDPLYANIRKSSSKTKINSKHRISVRRKN